MLIVGLAAALVVSAPWLTLTIMLFAYIASFPHGAQSYKKLAAKTPKSKAPKSESQTESEQSSNSEDNTNPELNDE
jgi:hypothetical protein